MSNHMEAAKHVRNLRKQAIEFFALSRMNLAEFVGERAKKRRRCERAAAHGWQQGRGDGREGPAVLRRKYVFSLEMIVVVFNTIAQFQLPHHGHYHHHHHHHHHHHLQKPHWCTYLSLISRSLHHFRRLDAGRCGIINCFAGRRQQRRNKFRRLVLGE
jgi:hypothetical protein